MVITAEAIDPGTSYATRLTTFTDTGELTDLAGHHVEAPGPLAALRRLVDEERNADGLTPDEARDLHAQITQLSSVTVDADEGHVAHPQLGPATYSTHLETELTEQLDVSLTAFTDRLPPQMADESPEARGQRDRIPARLGSYVPQGHGSAGQQQAWRLEHD